MAAAAVDNILMEKNSLGSVEGAAKHVHSNYVPAQLEKHLQFIDFNTSGDFVVGCSSLNTRYWTGSLWCYKSGTEAGDVVNPDKCLTGLDLETGVFEGRFVREDEVVLGLDSGGVMMVNLTSDQEGDKVTSYLEQGVSTVEHDDMLTGLDIWTRDGSVATVGLDNRLCVYNPGLGLLHSYSPVHSGQVTSVSCDQTREHVLATCSRNNDSCVRVWDTRQSKPASTVWRSADCHQPPSSLTWLPGSDSLLVGHVTGHVSLIDLRSTNQQVTRVSAGNRPVYRLRVRGELVGVAQDDAVVSVIRVKDQSLEIVLAETKHSDFVRGLAWSQDQTLWSVGWDKSVQTYKL